MPCFVSCFMVKWILVTFLDMHAVNGVAVKSLFIKTVVLLLFLTAIQNCNVTVVSVSLNFEGSILYLYQFCEPPQSHQRQLNFLHHSDMTTATAHINRYVTLGQLYFRRLWEQCKRFKPAQNTCQGGELFLVKSWMLRVTIELQ